MNICAAPNDLTAAATIRETAMRLFAERGAAAVTIRDVAAEAGVSPSLVIHHYGSKEGLKAAVDERATALVETFVKELTEHAGGGGAATSLAAAFSQQIEREPVLPSYLRRLLVEGGPAADGLFRTLFEATRSGLASLESEGLVRATADADVRAAFLLVNDLAVVLLRDQLRSVLAVDPLTPAGTERWTAQILDTYARGVFVLPAETSGEGLR
ncbi:MAG: TetR/AcrR family transcriptional regulator [Candidatus Dormibacteria bacterium]